MKIVAIFVLLVGFCQSLAYDFVDIKPDTIDCGWFDATRHEARLPLVYQGPAVKTLDICIDLPANVRLSTRLDGDLSLGSYCQYGNRRHHPIEFVDVPESQKPVILGFIHYIITGDQQSDYVQAAVNVAWDSLDKSIPVKQSAALILNYPNITSVMDKFEDLIIRPNPAGERVVIDWPDCLSGNFRIYNSDGQLIVSFDNLAGVHKTIDLSEWSKGVYWLLFTSGNQSKTKAIVKK